MDLMIKFKPYTLCKLIFYMTHRVELDVDRLKDTINNVEVTTLVGLENYIKYY